jgi:2-hydroxy-3-keto-5-methylthiopentenyl-1-phosphate phosphatase
VTTGRGAPVAVPPLRSGDPPLAFVVDYDGTIARTDVTDTILAEFVTGDREAEAAAYDAGLVGSRAQMVREIGLITADAGALLATAAAQPHDATFRPFAERARAAGIPVEVVSDGFGFFIEPALRALGAGWVPIVTAHTRFGPEGATIEFPNGNRDCFVCGTCKRERVRAHQAAGRAVVFIGDGASDRYAAGYADVVFAKRALVTICVEAGWAFRRWTEFAEIDAWLAERLDEFAADPAALPAARPRPPFCGAEVWGPGRWDPAPPARD